MPILRRPAAIVAVALTGALLATGTASAGTTTLGQPAPISGPTPFDACPSSDPTQFRVNSETETMIAVNPANPRHIATIWQQDRFLQGSSRGIVVAVSLNAGRTWKRVALPGMSCPTLPGRATNPWLSFSPDGTLHATATITGTQNAVYATRSTDGGSTWSPVSVLASDPIVERFSDKQTTTVDPADPQRVYTVWNRQIKSERRSEILLATSTDGGTSWEPARPIYSPPAPAATVGNQIVVLRDGTLLNLFFQNDLPIGSPPSPNLTDHVKVIRSTDHGVTWSQPVTIADVRLNIPLLPDTFRPLIAPGLVPDIAVDPVTGAVYVVWGDANLSTSRSAVGLSASYDGGLTWSAPQRVDRAPESPAGGAGQAFLPQVDVARNGTVAVTYYDFRNNTPEPGATTDYWMVTCKGRLCGRTGGTWRERHLAGPFAVDTAGASFGGPFIGTYVGLTHRRGSFLSAFVMTTGDPANPQDVFVVCTPATPWAP